MNLTYDELYEKYYKLTRKECGKYKFKTDKEDVLQDLWLDIYMKYEKLIDRLETVEYQSSYMRKYAETFFKEYLLEEHKKGLWLDDAGYRDYIDIFESDNEMIYKVDTTINKKGEVVVIDEYVKRFTEHRKEYFKKWRENIKNNEPELYKKYLKDARERSKKRLQRILSNPEEHQKYLEYHRQRYHDMKYNNPEKYEKYLKYHKERLQHILEDPEEHQKYLEYHRQRYYEDKKQQWYKEYQKKLKEKRRYIKENEPVEYQKHLEYHREYNKKYYEELKKDPERYRQYLDAKNAKRREARRKKREMKNKGE